MAWLVDIIEKFNDLWAKKLINIIGIGNFLQIYFCFVFLKKQKILPSPATMNKQQK